MCPHAELLLGRIRGLDEEQRLVQVATEGAGGFQTRYEQLVLALGSVARTLPVPGLAEHARGIEIHVGTTLESVGPHEAVLSNGLRIPALTLVWTAGVKAHPLL